MAPNTKNAGILPQSYDGNDLIVVAPLKSPYSPLTQEEQQQSSSPRASEKIHREVTSEEYWDWRPEGDEYWTWTEDVATEAFELVSCDHIEENLEKEAQHQRGVYWDMSERHKLLKALSSSSSSSSSSSLTDNSNQYWDWNANPTAKVLTTMAIEINLRKLEGPFLYEPNSVTNRNHDDYWDTTTAKDREARKAQPTEEDMYWMESTKLTEHKIDTYAYWDMSKAVACSNFRSDDYWCW